MVRHIVIWDFADGFTQQQNQENAKNIKKGLEQLAYQVDGAVELKVIINLLPTSNGNVILNSLFADENALAAYQENDEHKRIGLIVRSTMKNRKCMDYLEE